MLFCKSYIITVMLYKFNIFLDCLKFKIFLKIDIILVITKTKHFQKYLEYFYSIKLFYCEYYLVIFINITLITI